MSRPCDRLDDSGLRFGLWHLTTGCANVDRTVERETYLRPALSDAILVASGMDLRAGTNDYPTPTWNASASSQVAPTQRAAWGRPVPPQVATPRPPAVHVVPTQVLGTSWALRQASMRQRWCSRRQAQVHRRKLFPTQVEVI